MDIWIGCGVRMHTKRWETGTTKQSVGGCGIIAIAAGRNDHAPLTLDIISISLSLCIYIYIR